MSNQTAAATTAALRAESDFTSVPEGAVLVCNPDESASEYREVYVRTVFGYVALYGNSLDCSQMAQTVALGDSYVLVWAP